MKAKKESSAGRVPMRYDAYGRPLREKKKGRGKAVFRFFFFFLFPYLIINGAILYLAISRPTVSTDDPDTSDYKSASIRIRLHSLLPIKNVKATLEGEPVELKQDGEDYIASLSDNGNLNIRAESINWMSDSVNVQVSLLDRTGPVIDKDSVDIGSGYVEFQVSDTQSGVSFDSIYGVDSDGDNVKPIDINKESGGVTMPMKAESITVYLSDQAGNQSTGKFSLS